MYLNFYSNFNDQKLTDLSCFRMQKANTSWSCNIGKSTKNPLENIRFPLLQVLGVFLYNMFPLESWKIKLLSKRRNNLPTSTFPNKLAPPHFKTFLPSSTSIVTWLNLSHFEKCNSICICIKQKKVMCAPKCVNTRIINYSQSKFAKNVWFIVSKLIQLLKSVMTFFLSLFLWIFFSPLLSSRL